MNNKFLNTIIDGTLTINEHVTLGSLKETSINVISDEVNGILFKSGYHDESREVTIKSENIPDIQYNGSTVLHKIYNQSLFNWSFNGVLPNIDQSEASELFTIKTTSQILDKTVYLREASDSLYGGVRVSTEGIWFNGPDTSAILYISKGTGVASVTVTKTGTNNEIPLPNKSIILKRGCFKSICNS